MSACSPFWSPWPHPAELVIDRLEAGLSSRAFWPPSLQRGNPGLGQRRRGSSGWSKLGFTGASSPLLSSPLSWLLCGLGLCLLFGSGQEFLLSSVPSGCPILQHTRSVPSFSFPFFLFKLKDSLYTYIYTHTPGNPGSESKESASSAGDTGSIPGSGRSPGEGKGNPLQYFCPVNPMDRGVRRATGYMRSHRVRHDWSTLAHTHSSLTVLGYFLLNSKVAQLYICAQAFPLWFITEY